MKHLLILIGFLLLFPGCASSVGEQKSATISGISNNEQITTTNQVSVVNLYDLSMNCNFFFDEKSISCEIDTDPSKSTLKWSSNATSRTMQGTSKFEFDIENFLPSSIVNLEICTDGNCDVITSVLDTSSLESNQIPSSPDSSVSQNDGQSSLSSKTISVPKDQKDLFFQSYSCNEISDTKFSMFYPIELIDQIVPMGKLNAGSGHVTPTDHLYIQRNSEAIKKDNQHYIKSPATGHIVRITREKEDQLLFGSGHNAPRSSPAVPDHRIVILHSCSFMTIFIHLGELAPEIVAETGTLGPGEKWQADGSNFGIAVSVGDPIARFGDDSLDWSMHDANIQLPGLIAVDDYRDAEPWKIHTVDPFQYFKDKDRTLLTSKVKRVDEPKSGKIDYDILDKIVGNWFIEGTSYKGSSENMENEYWGGHLTIAYDHIDPKHIVLSTGRKIGMNQEVYDRHRGVFRLQGMDPALVGPEEGLVKYQLFSWDGDSELKYEINNQHNANFIGTMLVQHLGDGSIRVEIFSGITPTEASYFTANSRIYNR